MVSTLEVILLVVAMGITSVVAGLIPLIVALLAQTLNLTSLLSMGILVSTSLVVVIPEGMENVFSSSKGTGSFLGYFLLLGFFVMYLLDNVRIRSAEPTNSRQDLYMDANSGTYVPSELDLLDTPSNSFFLASLATNFKQRVTVVQLVKSIYNSSTTIGLVIHALIDGILLGSSFLKMDSFHIIIFLSLIIHKIPTCFSLSTILIKEQLPPKVVCYHLLLFALSLPVLAVITYFALSVVALSEESVGYLLLFSGGTFLYVVIHVMFDVASASDYPPPSSDSEATAHNLAGGLEWKQLLCALIGMVIPVCISLLGEH